jgi:hypothetical protein
VEQLRKGEIAAVVFITSKPVDAFARGKWEGGYKFLPVPYQRDLEQYYLPSTLYHEAAYSCRHVGCSPKRKLNQTIRAIGSAALDLKTQNCRCQMMGRFRTHAPQQNDPLLDHLIGHSN